MDKYNLISVMDMMIGLTDEEINNLKQKDYEEVESYYINRYQEQNDDQLEIVYK